MVDIFLYEINFSNIPTKVNIALSQPSFSSRKHYTNKFESDLAVLRKCPLTEVWIKKMWYMYTMEYEP